ncbi:hypothetical protein [Agrobacterium vitis]|uniref:hypothetical protein n=1 Tax=Agrobacterium vitis TaxID=373 RepID=UPI0020345366|nr:hypothetical protein [Agrobacterium vitis]MCM2448785.1 hypothetical protein [Agrobacterium vitis]
MNEMENEMEKLAVRKRLVDGLCLLIRAGGINKGHTGSYNDAMIMQVAKYVAMKRGGRAEAYLGHYLAGSGTAVKFSIKQLMDEDAGVRLRIYKWINDTVAVAEKAGRPVSVQDDNIPIPQRFFHNEDWQFATGSLNVRCRFVDLADKGCGKHIVAEVWCGNVYQWHPNEPRLTQSLHQAAVNLQTPKPDTQLRTAVTIGQSLVMPASGATTGVMPNTLDANRDGKDPFVVYFKAAKNFRMYCAPERIFVPKSDRIDIPSLSTVLNSGKQQIDAIRP